ncbi:uncharacterized protein PAN0_001d0222 [Moesziomyces antarcticus]|uniref:CBM21 domain-containing protein n=1 Tax=Pseudozyma antarctica TaxID=84753 RepID=A0A5C3FDQ9_PSEA2|nr:uncharacterized protein PAN0_001d0222 [Moesziomyces antarcticus]GAK62026.1 conserved hypothetical protein [Moesziomyces antarcticus]SPO42553.1 uncharacterized protein PSANT_00236 [Moesziomyces antarcticus]
MLVSAPLQSYDRASIHRPQYHSSRPYHTPTEKGTAGTMTLSSSHADMAHFTDGRPAVGTSSSHSHIETSSSASSESASASLPSANLAQPVPTRPKNHVRGVASDSRVWTTGRGFFEGRYRERQSYVSAQEQKDLEAERDAILQIQNVQAAKRRAKMMRLTPAFPASRDSTHTPSPPSSEASSARTASDDVATPPDSRVPFPSPKTRIGLAAAQNMAPLHPGSRKALALKANSPGPEVLGGLSLDLHCLPSPAGDRSSISSTTSTNSELLRKKSGEPVKSSLKQYSGSYMVPRSASDAILPSSAYGTKSVPTTPSAPKFVHFDTQLERIKIFKVKGRPQAVSREGSPEHTETETEEERDYPWFGSRRGGSLGRTAGSRSPTNPSTPPATEPEEQLVLRLPNFPSSAKLSLDKDIFLERIYLSDDLRSVRGTVQVKNLSFEKWVAVRFTLDHWATVNEVSAEYSESIKDGTADRFVFSIKLNEVLNWPRGAGLDETKTIFLCLRYTTGGREIWDNNDGGNYQLDFRKRPAQPAEAPRLPPTSAEGRAAAATFGNTVPRRYTLSSMGPTSTSSIIEMGRRTGVYGQKATRDNAMERLKQELERLRSDEEEAEKAPMSGTFASEMSKRRSPPVSPGGAGKPSSPSMWSARYDFGASLRDPKSGSRKTEAGRAAALDYFSARPSAVVASSPVRSSFVVSAATPSPDGSTPRSAAELVPKFGRLGMLSPGLGEVVIEHAAVNSSNTSSPTGSLLQVPQVGSIAATSPAATSGSRFNSFPPNRNGQARSVFGIWDDEANGGNGSGSGSASGSASVSRSGTPPSPIGFATTRIEIKGDGTVLEDYTPDGSQASPNSLNNSPNPFSPALSASSVDSDSTAMLDTKPGMTSSLDNLGNLSGPSAYRFLRADHLEGRTRPSSFTAGDEAEQHGYSSSALSSSTTMSPSSELATPDEEFMRPSNLTSFNELVARFCWNSDNQVPQTSPDASGLAAHTPTSASGRSTPIARAGGAY